jgi:hypothetical protein
LWPAAAIVYRYVPAMAAGLTDHVWSIAELLMHFARRSGPMRMRAVLSFLVACFLNNKRAYSLLLIAISTLNGSSTLPHGTAVITLFSHEGIAMASDGLAITPVATGDSEKPFRQVRGEAESKVAVCNKSFLCGMSGINPIVFSTPKIEYHFQKWLPITKAKTRPSVRITPRSFKTRLALPLRTYMPPTIFGRRKNPLRTILSTSPLLDMTRTGKCPRTASSQSKKTSIGDSWSILTFSV